MSTLFVSICRWLLPLLGLFSALSLFPMQREDYLTEDEIEQLREAQEPPQRIKLLNEFLKNRFEKVKALKLGDSAKGGDYKPNGGKHKGAVAEKKGATERAKSKRTEERQSEKSFADLMREYLQCLEEISSNVENFSSFNPDPKAYLKSLKNLDQSLEEHLKSILEISSKAEKAEENIVNETSEVLQELSADVKAGMQTANDQLKELKQSKKGKTSR